MTESTSKALDDRPASLGDKRLAGKARSDLDNARANQLSSRPKRKLHLYRLLLAPSAGASGNVAECLGNGPGNKQEELARCTEGKICGNEHGDDASRERKEKCPHRGRDLCSLEARLKSAARDPRIICSARWKTRMACRRAGTIEATADGGKSWRSADEQSA